MAGKIFINYRRDDSIGMAGRLHDRLAQTFGRNNLFIDVDHIPVGEDFVAHLNSQLAECNVVLVVIGPNWLGAKDETGGRRLDNPDDFVVIEIAAALARKIRVIPVLVDGARMPKESELPDSLKLLARRQAAEVRHAHFGHDAAALTARMRKVLGDEAADRWRVKAVIGAVAMAVLLLIGWGGYALYWHTVERGVQQAALKWEEDRKAAETEANRKLAQTEQERLAALKQEQDRQARAAAEADAKRKAEEAERQRAAAKAEQDRQARAAAEADAKRKAEEAEQQRLAARKGFSAEVEKVKTLWGSLDAELEPLDIQAARVSRSRNIASVIDARDGPGFYNRGVLYAEKGDYDRAIADFDEVVRLYPNDAISLLNRGVAYAKKGDDARAIANYDEAIRLNPGYALAFCYRGRAKQRMNVWGGQEDILTAKQLGAGDTVCK